MNRLCPLASTLGQTLETTAQPMLAGRLMKNDCRCVWAFHISGNPRNSRPTVMIHRACLAFDSHVGTTVPSAAGWNFCLPRRQVRNVVKAGNLRSRAAMRYPTIVDKGLYRCVLSLCASAVTSRIFHLWNGPMATNLSVPIAGFGFGRAVRLRGLAVSRWTAVAEHRARLHMYFGKARWTKLVAHVRACDLGLVTLHLTGGAAFW